jgi:hypothetical protein
MSDDRVRLIATRETTEINHAGVSYPVTPWSTVVVPADAVASLLKTGGCYIASDEGEALLRHSTLHEIYEAAWALPKGQVRDGLLDFIDHADGAITFL